GEIRLQSESGVGSIFTVYLPVLAPMQARRVHSTEDGWSETQAAEMTQKVLVARAGADSQWEADSAPAVAAAESLQATRSLLVVEDDSVQRQFIADMMASTNTRTVTVASGDEALAMMEKEQFDCVVLDLGLPGMSGWKVIEELQTNQALGSTPLLVYTARDLTRREELKLRRAAKSIVIKDARSPERLKQEVMTIFHEGAAGEAVIEMEANGGEPSNAMLAGKKVLVVD